MVNIVRTVGPLTLVCLTLFPEQHFDAFNAVKAAGLSSSFGIIVPLVAGIGMHHAEKHIGIEHQGSWRQDEFINREASHLLQTTAITILSSLTWAVLKGVCRNDSRLSWALVSIYCYGQGRAFYMSRPSSLQKGSSYLLPASLGIMAYSRIPELAPQLDMAGKSLLVFGLAFTCGM